MSTQAIRSGRWGKLLPVVFKIDRVMVLVSGVVFTFGGAYIADRAGWPTWLAVAIGLSMFPYAGLLHRIIVAERYTSRSAKISMQSDLAWVIASVALLLFGRELSTTAGNWVIALVAMPIADIGIAKWIGIRRAS